MTNPFKIFDFNNTSSDLTGKYKKSWIEEALDIESETSNRLAVSHTRNYIGTSIGAFNIKIFLWIIVVGISIIFLRVFFLQIIRGGYYRDLAEGNRIRLQPIPSERGIIFDRFNKELVQNVPSFSLAVVPQDLPRNEEQRKKIVAKLAEISGLEVGRINEILKKYGSYGYESLVIKENLNYETAIKLYIENSALPGILIESGSRRSYFAKDQKSTTGKNASSTPKSLSHLLGYLGKLSDQELTGLRGSGYLQSDSIGKTGLEKNYESFLRGTYGRKKIEVNASGKEQSILAVEPPKPGNNLILSLDLEAQKKLENLVSDVAEKTGKKKIAAIAMDPRNGEIIAMVSWPVFDNNKFSEGIDKETYKNYIDDPNHPLFNRAIAGVYPPGSTVKLVVSAAALQEKIISKNTVVNSVGGVSLGKWFFKDWKAGGHGMTNVTKAIAWSVNTFFYYVGGGYEKFIGLGVDKIAKYMTMFGISEKTGIDIPGEHSGFLPSKEWKRESRGETWFVGDTYNLSIGQGDLLVTPLQVAVWTSAIANDGKIVKPHLGVKLIDTTTNITVTLSSEAVKEKTVSSENLKIVREGMRDCVAYGSCKLLGTLNFTAAGKTGTAQWSKTHPTHAWFTSFAPYNDPKIVVTVLVEEGGEGATIAMPIAKNFLDWWGKKYLTLN